MASNGKSPTLAAPGLPPTYELRDRTFSPAPHDAGSLCRVRFPHHRPGRRTHHAWLTRTPAGRQRLFPLNYMARKPRSDAKLRSLPPHQREMLIRWLVDENVSVEKAVERVGQDFKVSTSASAVKNFYTTECFAQRSSEAKVFAESVAKELLEGDPAFDRVTLALVKQKAFERARAQDGSVAELATLSGIIGDSHKLALKQREVALSERRVALLEKKVAQADAADTVAKNPELSDAEKLSRYRQIFGAAG